MREYKNSIERIDNRIIIHRMRHPAAVTDFLNAVYQGINRGYKEFFIEWDGNSIFPNACTPISGIIQYYHNTTDIKFEFNTSLDSYLANCGFMQPYYKEAKEIINEYNPFDKIFEYSDSAQVSSPVK